MREIPDRPSTIAPCNVHRGYIVYQPMLRLGAAVIRLCDSAKLEQWHTRLIHDPRSKAWRTRWSLLFQPLRLINHIQLQTLIIWIQYPRSHPGCKCIIICLVSGSGHSRITIIIAVARLATSLLLHLHHHLPLLLGLILPRRPRWLTCASRITPSGSRIALTTIVLALTTFALYS